MVEPSTNNKAERSLHCYAKPADNGTLKSMKFMCHILFIAEKYTNT